MASLQAQVEASEADVRSNRDERARLADELGASEREVAALRDALDDGGDSGADVGLVEPQDSSADSTPPSLDDMGHHITEILRTARSKRPRSARLRPRKPGRSSTGRAPMLTGRGPTPRPGPKSVGGRLMKRRRTCAEVSGTWPRRAARLSNDSVGSPPISTM
jgi:hypothetical protein